MHTQGGGAGLPFAIRKLMEVRATVANLKRQALNLRSSVERIEHLCSGTLDQPLDQEIKADERI